VIGFLGFSNPLLALLGYLAGERLSSVVGEEFLEADLGFDHPQGRRFRSDTRSAATPRPLQAVIGIPGSSLSYFLGQVTRSSLRL
jgi:hypothetical protein